MACANAHAGPRIDLTLHAESSVAGPWIHLSDVADLESARGADPVLAERLAKVRLAAVPVNSSTIVLRVRDIAPVVRQTAVGRIGEITVNDGSEMVRIKPQLRLISTRTLTDTAIEQFEARCREIAERCTAAVDAKKVSAVEVPQGALVFDAFLAPRWLDRAGVVDVKLRITVDGVVVGVARVPLNWRAVREAWVVEGLTESGDALRRKDVRKVRIDAGAVDMRAVAFDPKSRLLRATSAVDRGLAIVPLSVEMLAEFRAGDDVPVSVALGHTRVTRKGLAVQDGRAGAGAFVRFDGASIVSGRVARSDETTQPAEEKLP